MRIALIGMSGLRVVDPDLIKLGMTLPGFLERGEAIASLPSLGLLTIAGITPPGHDIAYFESNRIENTEETFADFDLVAISTFTAQSLEAYELAGKLRHLGCKVVIGGLHATVLPTEVSQHADAAAVGDGECVWEEILLDAERDQLKPIYGDRNGRFDLAHASMPKYELLDIPKYNRLTVQTSRGCPFRCEFCASSILYSPKYRQKPIKHVLAELDRILELWPRPFIEFADDNSLVNKAYWSRLLPELAARRLRWFTETDISIANNPELLEQLTSSGCAQVLIGLESPIESGLAGLELRGDWKHKQWKTNLEAVRRIQSFGIRVNGCFVVGLDGHTTSIFDSIANFAAESGLFDVQITLPTPFPGTPMYERLKKAGRLTHDGEWNRCTLFDLNFVPDPMTPDELVTGFLDLAARLYNRSSLDQRREQFAEQWRRHAMDIDNGS